MNKTDLEIIRELNIFFGKNMFNEELLVQYLTRFDKNVLQDFNRCINCKNKHKIEMVSQLLANLQTITTVDDKQFMKAFQSSKKTDLSQLWTRLLIPKEYNRMALQNFRNSQILKLRKAQEIQIQIVELLKKIHNLVSLNLCQKKQYNMNNLKTLLISLKKLTGCGKSSKKRGSKVRKAKRNAYFSNIDIKAIIRASLDFITDEKLNINMKILLNKSKNKNWMGPNLYRCLKNANFTHSQMSTLLKALENVDTQQIQLNSNQDIVKKILKKITSNMKFYLQNTKMDQLNEQNLPEEQQDCNLSEQFLVQFPLESFYLRQKDIQISFIEVNSVSDEEKNYLGFIDQ